MEIMQAGTLVSGDIVLRQVEVSNGSSIKNPEYKKTILDPEFDVRDGGGLVIKAKQVPYSGYYFAACPSEEEGMVCFCNEDIPDDYTHFIVEKVVGKGSCAVVHPIVGNKEELLSCYNTPDQKKDELLSIVRENIDLVLEGLSKDDIAEVLGDDGVREVLEAWAELNRFEGPDNTLSTFDTIAPMLQTVEEIYAELSTFALKYKGCGQSLKSALQLRYSLRELLKRNTVDNKEVLCVV